MKKTLALILVFVLALCAIACGSETKTGEQTNDGIDWTKYPEKLEDWTIAELKTYLRAAGVIVDGDSNMYALDMSANELEATGVTAGHIYTNMTDGSIMDIFMEVRLESLLEELKSAHTVAGIPMDTLLGNFAFSYTGGYNEEHIAAFKKAIEDLGAHYGVTPDFIG